MYHLTRSQAVAFLKFERWKKDSKNQALQNDAGRSIFRLWKRRATLRGRYKEGVLLAFVRGDKRVAGFSVPFAGRALFESEQDGLATYNRMDRGFNFS
jgi:hypothetical protein